MALLLLLLAALPAGPGGAKVTRDEQAERLGPQAAAGGEAVGSLSVDAHARLHAGAVRAVLQGANAGAVAASHGLQGAGGGEAAASRAVINGTGGGKAAAAHGLQGTGGGEALAALALQGAGAGKAAAAHGGLQGAGGGEVAAAHAGAQDASGGKAAAGPRLSLGAGTGLSWGDKRLAGQWEPKEYEGRTKFGVIFKATYKGPPASCHGCDERGDCTPACDLPCIDCETGASYQIKVMWREDDHSGGLRTGTSNVVSANWKYGLADKTEIERVREVKLALSMSSDECTIAQMVSKQMVGNKQQCVANCMLNSVFYPFIDDPTINLVEEYDVLFLVLEYPGESLEKKWPKLLEDKSNIGKSNIHFVQIAQGVLEAVAAIHDKGFIHRDITKQAFGVETVGEELVVKLTNFDSAQKITEPFNNGNPRFRGMDWDAPQEEWKKQDLFDKDHAKAYDVFQLGSLLVWLLTGRTFFDLVLGTKVETDQGAQNARTIFGLSEALTSGYLVELAGGDGLPVDDEDFMHFLDLVANMLQYWPSQRPEDASTVVNDRRFTNLYAKWKAPSEEDVVGAEEVPAGIRWQHKMDQSIATPSKLGKVIVEDGVVDVINEGADRHFTYRDIKKK